MKGIDFKEFKKGAYSGKELPEKLKKRLEKQGKYQYIKVQTPGDTHFQKALKVIQAWNLQEEFDDIVNKKTHKDVLFNKKTHKAVARVSLSCLCSSCLFYTYKFFHPGSTISIENFFFGVVLITTAIVKETEGKRSRHDWTLAQRIMCEITGKDSYVYDENLEGTAKRKKRMTRYKTGLRSIRIVIKAFLDRIYRRDELVYYFLVRPSILRRRKRDLAWTKSKFKVLKFIREKKETSLTELKTTFQTIAGKTTNKKDFLYDLWDFERYGKIQFDPESKKIRAL